jgi:hypothetical protein
MAYSLNVCRYTDAAVISRATRVAAKPVGKLSRNPSAPTTTTAKIASEIKISIRVNPRSPVIMV